MVRTARIGTSTDDVRRRNLSGVLTLVHRHGGLSRAELTRRTELSRSTVKDLVEELAEHGLVEEAQPGAAAQVGRPSPVVRPQQRVLTIAVNPEIDAVTVGLVSLGGTVIEVTRHPTSGVPGVEETVALAAESIDGIRRRLEPDRHVTAIGVAVPGLVHAAGSMVRLAPHLDWHDAEIGELLSAATQLPVYAANDANLGAIAEHVFGGHSGAQHMIYVNGGAGGIGAGVVIAGELLDGAAGYAGELGHTFVGGAAMCHCGGIGCLETEVSQSQTNDPDAKTVERQAHYLGIALGNAVNVLNPGLIVLGGFLRVFPSLAPEVLNDALARHSLRAARDLVRIVPASLGSETLMIGAAELAFAPLLSDPAAHYHQRIDRDSAV
ncbi:ROK family transcriptional regulator [Mycobacterium sp. URHB0044]|uniref:ROK family transcriptional regulator n=1 Tax=Mycobacterium sp. URHB0044 TaxID=1380386 RepID=UPI001E2F0A54|nr:ROK family transcriptional regulator [Mycobacterium sp. URHB0044]